MNNPKQFIAPGCVQGFRLNSNKIDKTQTILQYACMCSGRFIRVAAHGRERRADDLAQVRGAAAGAVHGAPRRRARALRRRVRQQRRVLPRGPLRPHAAAAHHGARHSLRRRLLMGSGTLVLHTNF